MKNKLLGCEICQRVCPLQPAPIASAAPTLPIENPKDFSIELLLRGTTLEAIGDRIGTNYARLSRVQAQAAIIAGNSGNPAYLPILEALAIHQNETLAEHAKWAIQSIRNSIGSKKREGGAN